MKQISIQGDKIQSRSKTNGIWSDWSEISGNGGSDIDDTTTSLEKTWSSSKTSTELGAKVDKNGTDRLITQSEADKLSGINEHWKGSYISLTALKNAHPTANPGDEATIDAGVGTQAQKAIWDDTDGDWYISSGTPITVDQSINEGSINPVAGGAVFSGFAAKQNTLQSGQNIKTINNQSILGSGNIDVDTVKQLSFQKRTLNGDLDPSIYPVDKQRTITGYKLASNCSDFSITVNGTNYTKADITNVIVQANSEILLNDITINAGQNVGNVIIYLS